MDLTTPESIALFFLFLLLLFVVVVVDELYIYISGFSVLFTAIG